ncbi:PaaI family thioesterase [Aciditerrimonas ferrireducens]|uniref:PaaI family thioesterase n=1 Tax=Aciditerrimonas ferrireducens TaxID=667306 RepID=UPI002002EADB|nr:PaaI family thioesterase [Aciditerrimonas ferrireducens]MCK4176618.1 PaaI family thioesterase [Aciditerrimonas ferrireducens]
MSPARHLQVPPNCDLTLGLVCEDKTTPGRTRWRMLADERFVNPAGIVQGGFLAALCDSAMGAATVTWAAGRPVWTANVEMKVSFLRPVRPGTTLWCTAEVVGGGRRVAFVEAEVRSATEVVARASSTYLLTERTVPGQGDDPPAGAEPGGSLGAGGYPAANRAASGPGRDG